MSPTARLLTIVGFGVGAYVIANRRPPTSQSLRYQAIEAQHIAAEAARRARELAAMASDEETGTAGSERGIYRLGSS